MTEAASLARRIADAFPRVKKSTNTKRNWVYEAHASLAAAMPEAVLPPRKYKEAFRSGVYIDTSRNDTVQFLQMPFLSDIAYMLASDFPDRVQRAQACVNDALKAMDIHLLSRLLERAFYSLKAHSALAIPPEELKHPFMALIAAFAATCVFAKLHLAASTNRVTFTWGKDFLYDFVPQHDGKHAPSLELLHTFCIIQTCSTISYMAAVGNIDAKQDNSPPSLIDSDGVFFDSWGVGWLLWQLLDVVQKYGPSVCKTQTEAIERLCVLFPMSIHVAEQLVEAFIKIMPAVEGTSADIRDDVLKNRRYTLWPGVTDILWKEGGLEKLTLLSTAPAGHVFSVLHGRMDLSGVYAAWTEEKDVPLQFFVEVPLLDNDRDWDIARKNALDGPDDLAIPMEAIRMCCVPTEQKVRRNRVPLGYVQAPKTGRKSKVKAEELPVTRVTYIPRVRRVAPTSGEASSGDSARSAGTGRTHALHQVSGFLRQLPLDWKASDAARQNAEASGISLPQNGVTFVRPHSRGGEATEGETRRTVKVRRPKE